MGTFAHSLTYSRHNILIKVHSPCVFPPSARQKSLRSLQDFILCQAEGPATKQAFEKSLLSMTHRLKEVLSRQDPRFLSHSYEWEKWGKPSGVSRRDGLQSYGVSVSVGLPWCSHGISFKRKTHALLGGNTFSYVLADKKNVGSQSVMFTK